MNRFKESTVTFYLLAAFIFSFLFSVCAEAQEVDGEFEFAMLHFIDAVKVGQVGLIVMALVQVLKTRLASMLILWVSVKLGAKAIEKQPTAVLTSEIPAENLSNGQDQSAFAKYVTSELPKIPSAVLPLASVALGGLTGIAESIATGKPLGQAAAEGLLSGGAAMAFHSLLKPLIKKFLK